MFREFADSYCINPVLPLFDEDCVMLLPVIQFCLCRDATYHLFAGIMVVRERCSPGHKELLRLFRVLSQTGFGINTMRGVQEI
jgi:hypothetical protein